MGGNVAIISKGKEVMAEKIPISKIGRKKFINTFEKTFLKLDSMYYQVHKEHIWKDKKALKNGMQYNGSTSYIFDPSYSDEEIEKYKPYAGDIDIIVPESKKKDFSEFMKRLEGKEIIKGVTYLGSNRLTDQMSTIFRVDFGKGNIIHAQVDFEFLPTDENERPTEWAKFSHNSSFEDQKAGIKALHHKYIIRAMVRNVSKRPDVVFVTPSATTDNWQKKLKKVKEGDIPHMLKFSVNKGIRFAFEPLYDENGNQIKTEDGKEVWREVPTSKSDYTSAVKEIAKIAFNKEVKDMSKFSSFKGIVQLIKENLDKKTIKKIFEEYEDLLFGKDAQIIELGNPEGDYKVKMSGYKYFADQMGFKINDKLIEKYYKNFPERKSLIREALRRAYEKIYH